MINVYRKIPFVEKASCVAVGNFDGVHKGHKDLISHLIQNRHDPDLKAVLISFWPHPQVIFKKIGSNFYLTTFEEKIKLINKAGVDNIITLVFDESRSKQSADEFLEELHLNLHPQTIFAGRDFRFGKKGEGNLPRMQSLLEKLDIKYNQIEPVMYKGFVISSERIRKDIVEGNIENANAMLGYPYEISGEVIKGKGIGSRFGFPTANIDFDRIKILPKNGVYATWAVINQTKYAAVTNVGVRPTFENSENRTIETSFLDFDGNIYGEKISVAFNSRIRDEIKFSHITDLIEQIEKDKKEARRRLE
jgi:riboflavin kinase/FMN adenylyltransferase